MRIPGMLGRIGAAITVALAGLVIGTMPAHAATNYVRYENVGNPTWCMGAFIGYVGPSLRKCNGSAGQLWTWTAESRPEMGTWIGLIMLRNSETGACLTAESSNIVATRTCDTNPAGQHWDVWGQNGWVVYQQANTLRCVVPRGTAFPGTAYDLELITCPDRNNVPNLFAWYYH